MFGRVVPAAALAAMILSAAGCGEAERGLMVRIPPPRGWEEGVESFRRTRDEYFKTSVESPLLADDVESFAGLEYWEPDAELYFVGQIHAYTTPEQVMIVTTAGQERPAEIYGFVRFRVGGAVQTLQVYRMLDSGPLADVRGFFLAFYDDTSGKLTYPAGRYLDFGGQLGGPYVLDFNMAFNPSCAYGDPGRFACPVAPQSNRISHGIEAGERGYKEAPPG
jgi:uncharacterized protein (DUF1684 family)